MSRHHAEPGAEPAQQSPVPASRRVDLEGVRERRPVREVLVRMGIDPPPAGPVGSSGSFRVPAAALGLGHGRDDSQGVLIKPDQPRHCWWAFHDQVGGDVIELVRAATGTSLMEAVVLLEGGGPIAVNRDPGVSVDAAGRVQARSSFYEDPDLDRTPVERVRAINAEAWHYYTLPVLAERARAYLAGRGIDLASLEDAAGAPLAGHTPRSPTGLVDQLRRRGFSDDELVDSGWAARPRATAVPATDGSMAPGSPAGAAVASVELRDRFRDRVLLPFRDEAGRVAGVTGRSVDWEPGSRAPKYLNHPRTVTFDKSEVLYRPVEHAVSSRASAVVVEGTLDALAIAAQAASAGVLEHFAPVSQSGVSLTPAVAERVCAITPRPPIVCGDADSAGMLATARWATSLMRTQHREVLALTLPAGADPASWLGEHGASGLAAFSSWDCLDDRDRLRPRPAGGAIAAAAIDAARTSSPDVPLHALAAPVVEMVANVAAASPGAPAEVRFAEEAAARIVAVIDGLPASWYARRIRERASQISGRPPPQPPLPMVPARVQARFLGE